MERLPGWVTLTRLTSFNVPPGPRTPRLKVYKSIDFHGIQARIYRKSLKLIQLIDIHNYVEYKVQFTILSLHLISQ